MNILITGGCGFLGSNLAHKGLEHGDTVTVLDNLSRTGSAQNLHWLQLQGNIRYIHGDVRNPSDVNGLIRESNFDVLFHLAGQVAMTTSIQNPYKDFEINALGSLNVLEAIRKYSPETAVLYSSTNKVYGDLEQYQYSETPTRYECIEYPDGFTEDVPLDFHSPYGCSKGSADQYMLDYARIFGLNTVVFRHSSMYGSRQFATADQGWIGWFCQQALEQVNNHSTSFTISGNGKQVRDILHAEDMIRLYFAAATHTSQIRGQAFNIGGSMAQSLSLLELFTMLESILHVKLNYTKLPPRESDQRVFVADTKKIKQAIGWEPTVTREQGITSMLNWLRGE